MRRVTTALLAAAVAAATAVGAGAGAPTAAAPLERVIVQSSSVQAAAAAVQRAGGQVTRPLQIVDGVAALLPAGARLPGAVVTPDAPVTSDETGGNPSTVKSVYRSETGADDVHGAPLRQVAVAVIDTGISPIPQLQDNLLKVPDPVTKGQLADCANFSAEQTCDDSYGHGTFLAGLIAGDEGMDPNAKLVAIKIAGRSGSADVSQVLAGIQYTVSFAKDLNIKVLNLSLGTNSTHDYRYDPLNRAVERAWQAGITVVVAASNRGPDAQTISKPGDDPLVVTVGAVDDRETPSRSDDSVPAFTGRGPVLEGPTGSIAKPDVVAPGVGLISLNVAGSHIDQTAGPSTYGVPGYRRGSGTSQATAVVSGAAALLLERTSFTPDQVKAALRLTAQPVSGPTTAVGSGLIDVDRAQTANVVGAVQAVPSAASSYDSLDASRGTVLVTGAGCGLLGDLYRQLIDPKCDYVHGDGTAKGMAFKASDYANGDWSGQSWYASQWAQGQSWYGQSWYGQSWYGQSWYGASGAEAKDGERTPLGTVLPGSAWYGVWR
jgi:serine protease AprX